MDPIWKKQQEALTPTEDTMQENSEKDDELDYEISSDYFTWLESSNSRIKTLIDNLNDQVFDEKFTLETRAIPLFLLESFKEKTNELKEPQKYEFKSKHILEEAMDSSTGYLMPYDGAFEILHDPLFNFIRFREYEDFISIVIADKNE